jgi:hypothetical protein
MIKPRETTVSDDNIISTVHSLRSLREATGIAAIAANVEMTDSDGFTIFRFAPLEVPVGPEAVVTDRVSPDVHEPLRDTTEGTMRGITRSYTGPLLKPREVERLRRQASGVLDSSDASYVPCPTCGDAQTPRSGKRCPTCNGTGMVPYWSAHDPEQY